MHHKPTPRMHVQRALPRTCIRTPTYTYTYKRTRTPTYTYTYAHTYVHLRTRVHPRATHTSTCHTCTYTRAPTHTRAYTHAHLHTRAHSLIFLYVDCTTECTINKIYLAPIQGIVVPSPDNTKFLVNKIDETTGKSHIYVGYNNDNNGVNNETLTCITCAGGVPEFRYICCY